MRPHSTGRAILTLCLFAAFLTLAVPVAFAEEAATKTATTTVSSATTQAAEAPAAEGWPPGALMEALDAAGARKALEDLSLRFYGYVETGITGRLTGGQDPLPFRAFDARRPNNIRLNQLSLTAERTYDTAKAFDFGAKVQGLFGGDAMLTPARGLLDHAGEGNGDAWADLFQAYVTAWFKTGEESGLEVLFGKFGTPMGYEATESPLAPFYSRSFLFNLTPFTHTGLKLTYTFNPQLSAYFAVVEGWDVFEDNNDAHTYMAGGTWTSAEKVGENAKHTVALCVMTGPEQDDRVHHYRTAVEGYYTRWWTEKLSQTIEVNFGTEHFGEDVDFAGGRDHWYGVAHYLSYICCDQVTANWRAEWVRDEHGFFTGASGNIFENTLGLTLTPWPNDKCLKNLSFRPEIRWDFACDPVFGDDRRNQVTAAIDAIFKF